MSVSLTFVSGHYFGFRALAGILESSEYSSGDLEVSLLLSLDEAKKAATVGFYDFSAIATKHNIPHQTIKSVKHDSTGELIRKASPDFLLAIGLSELVPSGMLDIPKTLKGSANRHSRGHGCIGMHPTLLPLGRGRAPIPWAIIKGLDQTGVTAFLLEEAADSGGILLQEPIQLSPRETATTLFDKCATAHQSLGRNLASMLAGRSVVWVDQDASRATVWPKRKPLDGLMSFDESIHTIDGLVRALTAPYPGAFFYYETHCITVHEVELITSKSDAPPGSIISVSSDGMPTIAARDGAIKCIALENNSSDVRFKVGLRLNQ
jgi:methionyl-tRNA formyltransferase